MANKKLLEIVGGIGLGISSLFFSGNAYAGNMKIESVPDKTSYVPGEQIKLDVIADSTQIPDKKIRSAEWDIRNIPDYLIFNSGELPSPYNPSTNPEDFFYGLFMNSGYNRVDNSLSGGELNDNVRGTFPGNDGAQNRAGLLGSYYFSVSPSAPLGESFFDLNGVKFYDTNSARYSIFDENLQITETHFTIANPKLTGNVNLEDYLDNISQVPIGVELRQDNITTRTDNVSLDANGNFTLDNVTAGTYDVYVKASHWLQRKQTGVVVNTAITNLDNVSLINGDSDNDNYISSADLGIVTNAIDSEYDSRADLDGDGEVSSTDLSIVLGNIDKSGDN